MLKTIFSSLFQFENFAQWRMLENCMHVQMVNVHLKMVSVQNGIERAKWSLRATWQCCLKTTFLTMMGLQKYQAFHENSYNCCKWTCCIRQSTGQYFCFISNCEARGHL